MCNPAVATLAITAAATAASLYSQGQQVKYQNQANQRQAENAIAARDANVNQTNLEMVQEREKAMQNLEQNNLKADAAKATAITSAGESGISGLSVGSLLDELSMNQSRYNNSVVTNYDRTEVALENQRQNANISAGNVIAGLRTPNAPDYAGAALRIAGAYGNYANSGGSAKIGPNKVSASYYTNPEF
jgi:hypothetical protein